MLYSNLYQTNGKDEITTCTDYTKPNSNIRGLLNNCIFHQTHVHMYHENTYLPVRLHATQFKY